MVRFLTNQAIEEMKDAAKSDNFERIADLQRNIQNLKQVEKELSDKLGKRTINF
jgi:DNA primase